MDGLVATLALSAGAVLALLVATWLVSLALRDVSIVDVAWGWASWWSRGSRSSAVTAMTLAARCSLRS